MKSVLKLILIHFLIFIQSVVGFSQTSVITKDYYQIKGDVIAVEEHRFFASKAYPNVIVKIRFHKNLVEEVSETHPKFKINHNYTFTHTKPLKSYSMNYQRFKNGMKNIDSTTTFQSVECKNLIFFYPKDSLQITKSSFPLGNRMEVSFILDNKEEIRWLEISSDSTITETNYSDKGRVKTYHINGNLLEKNYPYHTSKKYYYNDFGFIVEEEFNDKIMNRNRSFPILTKYLYEYDSYGNWIKRIKVLVPWQKQNTSTAIKNYTARKLTYKNGTTTGSTNYDNHFIQTTIQNLKN